MVRLLSRLLYHFVAHLELPLVFAIGVLGALYCFSTGRSAAALLLLIIAAIAALIWATVARPHESS